MEGAARAMSTTAILYGTTNVRAVHLSLVRRGRIGC